MEAYQALGYHFVVITDHDQITKAPAVPGILLIPGWKNLLLQGTFWE